MDLIYMSDAMAYQSIRGHYPYYDRSWEQKLPKKSQDKQRLAHQQKSKSNGQGHGDKETCKICKEQQRRALKAYIRSKSHEERDESCIVEENEEEELTDHHNSNAKKT